MEWCIELLSTLNKMYIRVARSREAGEPDAVRVVTERQSLAWVEDSLDAADTMKARPFAVHERRYAVQFITSVALVV